MHTHIHHCIPALLKQHLRLFSDVSSFVSTSFILFISKSKTLYTVIISYQGKSCSSFDTRAAASRSTHSPIHAVAIEVDDNGGEIETIEDKDDDDNEEELHSAAAIVINEFLRTIFPGRTLFKGKGNALELISTYHNYFSMFAGSGLTRSRTIRFLKVITVVLSCIFADTLFFGIYFPSNSTCAVLTDKVRM